jgi:hypothetical protein
VGTYLFALSKKVRPHCPCKIEKPTPKMEKPTPKIEPGESFKPEPKIEAGEIFKPKP